MSNGINAGELARVVGGRLCGDESVIVERVASLEAADSRALSFVEGAKGFERARSSRAACLLVPESAELEGKCLIQSRNPKLAFARAAAILHRPRRAAAGIHPTAVIAASAQLGEDVSIGALACLGEECVVGARTEIRAGANIGHGVRIGADCLIYPNVYLADHVTIGDRVILHAGVVVGADGFGYVRDGARGYVKFPQIGTVTIEDDVEIGANSCIDRGSLGETRIGRGTKIDNLVQIAHNVDVGEHVIIVSQTGVSGSTVIESDCVIGGQVGIGEHARLERGTMVGAKSGVGPGKVLRAGQVWFGIPVRPLPESKRINALVGRLPELRAEMDELRAMVGDMVSRKEE